MFDLKPLSRVISQNMLPEMTLLKESSRAPILGGFLTFVADTLIVEQYFINTTPTQNFFTTKDRKDVF